MIDKSPTYFSTKCLPGLWPLKSRLLNNWIAQYKKMGILLLKKLRGDRLKWDVSQEET